MTKKISILQINTLETKGGAAKVVCNLKDTLCKYNYNVSLFVKQKYSNDKNIFLIEKQNKLFNTISQLLKRLTKKDILNYLKNKTRPLLISDINFFNNKNLLNSKEFEKADIIHCHNLHGNYFNLKLLQTFSKIKPVVWTLHDMWAITSHYTWESDKSNDSRFNSLQKFYNLTQSNHNYLLSKKYKIYKNSKLNIVVPSLWLKEKIKKSILKDQPINLIYNGIDNKIFKKYDKEKIRQQLNLPQNKKIITFLSNGGKDNNQKGWEYTQHITDYYKDNNNILFLCIGGKKDPQQLNNSNIKFIDYISSQETLAQYYSASDIFLFTSLFEVFPLTVLEAMACGTPIVSFDVGGVKEAVIHKKNGYIAEHKNTDNLITGLEYIFKLNQNELNEMSENSIKRVGENYTIDIMTKNYIKLYEQILKK
jgi:glycosyltransferase involved in cell wall biosynthesis